MQTPDAFGCTNAIVAFVLSRALTIKVDEEISINVRSSVRKAKNETRMKFLTEIPIKIL